SSPHLSRPPTPVCDDACRPPWPGYHRAGFGDANTIVGPSLGAPFTRRSRALRSYTEKLRHDTDAAGGRLRAPDRLGVREGSFEQWVARSTSGTPPESGGASRGG